MSNSMRIKRKLPDAPPYHKVEISPKVAGYDSKYMNVIDHAPKPAPTPTGSRKKPNIDWTDDKLRQLGVMYDAGISLRDIGEYFSYTEGAISKYIRKARYKGYVKTERQAHRWWTEEEDNTVRLMKAQGKATDVIAKKLGRSRASVMNRLKLLRKGTK